MAAVAVVALLITALIHAYFLILEMFLWTTPRVRAIFGADEKFAADTRGLAGNQGLYNGFLAAGLVWGAVAVPPVAFPVRLFFLSCVVVAGVYGAFTVSRRILLVQAVPAIVALLLVGVAH